MSELPCHAANLARLLQNGLAVDRCMFMLNLCENRFVIRDLAQAAECPLIEEDGDSLQEREVGGERAIEAVFARARALRNERGICCMVHLRNCTKLGLCRQEEGSSWVLSRSLQRLLAESEKDSAGILVVVSANSESRLDACLRRRIALIWR